MTLRTKLWLVLSCVVLLPLAAIATLVLVVVPSVLHDRAADAASAASNAVVADLHARCVEVGLQADVVARDVALHGPAAAVAAPPTADAPAVAVVAASGAVVASAGNVPAGVASLPACSAAPTGSASGASATGPPQVADRAVVDAGGRSYTVVVSQAITPRVLVAMREQLGIPGNVALLSGGEVAVAYAPVRPEVVAAGRRGGPAVSTADAHTLVSVTDPSIGVPYGVLVTSSIVGAASLALPVAGVLVVGLLLALLLGQVVARMLTAPLDALTEASERVAQGDLGATIEVHQHRELTRLSSSFNRMTDALRHNMGELERTHEEMRSSQERIGDALTSTHDLDALLPVVLETAVVLTEAQAGLVYVEGAGGRLTLVAEQSMGELGLPVPVDIDRGVGVLGRVAVGEGVRGVIGSGDPELTPCSGEPSDGDVIAVPIRMSSGPVGVIGVFGREAAGPFTAEAERSLRTLANQAGIAIENVRLHDEARRLSTTDPLTGIGNLRYLLNQLGRETERASRFGRALALLMLDLDHFKSVNDAYGHARGDAVLRELAARVSEQIREVDTFARYGGEEFVLVLPETDRQGATQLAERIRVAVGREPFGGPGESPLPITVSVGAAVFPEHGGSGASLMASADRALYAAKAAGRDQWRIAEDQPVGH